MSDESSRFERVESVDMDLDEPVTVPARLSVLPLRDTVLFPNSVHAARRSS